MKLLFSTSILFYLFICLISCSKDSVARKTSPIVADTLHSLMDQWEAVGYFDVNHMASPPTKKWYSFKDNEKFTFAFEANGQLRSSGKIQGCNYQLYTFVDSSHFRFSSRVCNSTTFTLLKLSTDSLLLSMPWYEDQFIYVFVKTSNN
jgi:hypothetical protein